MFITSPLSPCVFCDCISSSIHEVFCQYVLSASCSCSLAPLSKCHPCTELCCNHLRADCQFINSQFQSTRIFRLYEKEPEASNLALNWKAQQSACSFQSGSRCWQHRGFIAASPSQAQPCPANLAMLSSHTTSSILRPAQRHSLPCS